MSILVTGAAGFIGANVVRMLVEDDRKVVGFDVAPPGHHTVIADIADKIPFVIGNVLDLALLANTIKEHKVEGIIHTAAMLEVHVNRRPIEASRINIEGTLNILEATRIFNLGRAVCCSSSAVAGEQRGRPLTENLKETDLGLPYSSMYAVSKLVNELHVHVYRRVFGVDAIACRPARIWGPGFNRWEAALPISAWVRNAVAGKPIKAERGGDTAIDYTYVKDHARGIIQALEAKQTKSCVFNLSTGRLVTHFEIADVMKQIFPGLSIEVGPGQFREIAAGGYHIAIRPAFDITRAREELGYDPRYGIEKGIPAYAAWLRERKYI